MKVGEYMVKNTKIISIFLIIMLIINVASLFINKTFAAKTTIDSVFDAANSFITGGQSNKDSNIGLDENKMRDNIGTIYNIFLVAGLIILVIVGIILGINLMFGATEEKAQIKEKLMPYTVGAVVIFGAFVIWKMVMTILNSVS